MQKVNVLKCPNCSASIKAEDEVCEYCGVHLTVSTFNSVLTMPAPSISGGAENTDGINRADLTAAINHLKLKKYAEALPQFEKAIESDFNNSEAYFYSAVCLLEGKKAFLHLRPTINKVLEYLDAAVAIEPRGIYYYFIAYVKYDYFKRKFLNVSPDYQAMLQKAKSAGYSSNDVQQLFKLLNVEKPSVLN